MAQLARRALLATGMDGTGAGIFVVPLGHRQDPDAAANKDAARRERGAVMSQLFALQLGDEWNLNDATTRTRLVDWFNSARPAFTNVILYHNNWGSQVGDTELTDFYKRARPDLLSFDTYPWQSVWDTNQPGHIGAPLPGPPTASYGDLRRYREHARAAGIPLGIYRQMFHSVQDYDQHVFRDPSSSEMRLNTFGALAFNVKSIVDFIYNTSASALFTKTFNGSGDTVISTNGLYI